MKHTENEAALERSLRSQVKVPPLDRRFDAAVWARIEADESRATKSSLVPVANPIAARWLSVINILGITTVAVLGWLYGVQMLAGSDIAVSWMELSAASRQYIVSGLSTGMAGAAILFGMMYTPWGRRLRAELG
jgi:hypothetical protein